MKRRSFLLCSILAPAAAVATVAAAAKPNGLRLSIEPEDPGYRAYCILNGDRKKITVFLDGVKTNVITADESLGMVYRPVFTPDGNLAHHGGTILHETVYGDVRIVVE